MIRIDPRRARSHRAGKTLVTFVLALPTLLGMVGLILDSGLLLASQRSAQNAADAGALAAAMEMFRGSSSTASSSATTFVKTYNGLSNATVTVNIPPASGAYSGVSNYVEVIVSVPFVTSFIQVLGANSNQTVTARAVAGFEPIAAGEGAIVLDPNAVPGITLNGSGSRLIVNGGVTVNSMGGGVDQYGNTVSSSLGNNTYAFRTQTSTQNPAPVVAGAIWVAGGIDNIANYQMYDAAYAPPNGNYYNPSNTDAPVFANLQTTAPDPLATLATPTTGNGVVQTYPQYLGNGQWGTASSPQSVSIGNSDTVTFNPGIYQSISINGGTVTFNPGIYVVGPGLGNGNGQSTLKIVGGTVTGSGVMFYNTGSDYTSGGTPDSNDGNTLGTDNNANFGAVSIGGSASVTLSPINNAGSPFNGILFYQRRWNTQGASIGGNTSTLNLTGTIYDKWGTFTLAGQGAYNAEFVVGSLSISGGAAVTINATGKNLGRVNQVYLVE
jgi:Flp pilus assembly protein TadG